MEADETDLVAPHGGSLVDLTVHPDRAEELELEAAGLKRLVLNAKQLCDIEQLVNGGFSPLTGFMNRPDYERVRDEMRLTDGTLWPMPITLDVGSDFAMDLAQGSRVALFHPEGALLAVLTVGSIWEPDLEGEASKVFGTTHPEHPGVNSLLAGTGSTYIGGEIEAVRPSQHHTYSELRHSPRDLRLEFASRGWDKVVAFQTRNPMHRAHVELTRRASADQGANLLIHPVVGLTKPGDVEYHTRVRCYRAVIGSYPENTVALSLLQLAMRMGGPREAVWHAIVRKNYGCSHLIVGRDHAGPGAASDGTPFYGPYEAQELVEEYADELGVGIVSFQMVVYDATTDRYGTHEELGDDADVKNLSGTQLRDLLNNGAEIPPWFSYPEVVSELRKSYPPKSRRGVVLILTSNDDAYAAVALSILSEKFLENGSRPVTVMDSEAHSSSLPFVAREVAKNGGAVLTSLRSKDQDVVAQLRDALIGAGELVHMDIADESEAYNTDADIAVEGISSTPVESAMIVIDRLRELSLIAD